MKRIWCILLPLFSAVNLFGDFVEDFNSATALSDTVFYEVFSGRGSIMQPDAGSAEQGLTTQGSLACSAGGDNELRVFENPDSGAGENRAVAPDFVFSDAKISGYMGAGITDAWGSKSTGLILRANGSGVEQDGYITYCWMTETNFSFALGVQVDGGVHMDNLIGFSETYAFDARQNNIYAELTTVGDHISASYWRVEADGHHEFLQTLSGTDSRYSEGHAGLYSYVRSTNSVYFDDVSVMQIPEPSSLGLCLIFGLGGFAWRKRIRT
ncbi:PEP-CTERM sorting domain-containing protein [Pontiella sp.]|uniref:PEP-CTERM sorting domain-containing protein n=1 Tax=Pontiella sp. TaxID=2837462 RepID=UPI003562B4FB